MRASRVAIVSAGVLSLVLSGLYAWAPAPGTRLPATAAPEPARGLQAPHRNGDAIRDNLRPAAAAPPSTSAQPGEGETRQGPAAADLEAAFATARGDRDPQRRVEALRWLGEYARQEHLDALQQIQIQDPAPEVRSAAEQAVNTLMARFMDQPWPGVAQGENPLDYMKDVPDPVMH